MGRLIDTSDLNNQIMLQKDLFGCLAVIISNVFEDIIRDTPTAKAIPKADYENRLKADMVDMLEDLKKEMNPIKECEYQIYGKEHWDFVGKCQDVIQQKINELKTESEDKE